MLQGPAEGQPGQCAEGAEVVGPAAEHLEPRGGAGVSKHDVDRILAQHSYAHPYTEALETKSKPVSEEATVNNDKGDIFYANCDEENDCVTIEVPCEDQVVEEVKAVEEVTPISIVTDFNLTEEYPELTFDKEMQLLSPMSLSPNKDNLSVSPSHTSISDFGYESLGSPLSESESMDLSDFWCDSFSELFPGLVWADSGSGSESTPPKTD